jgi:hypothetical protein
LTGTADFHTGALQISAFLPSTIRKSWTARYQAKRGASVVVGLKALNHGRPPLRIECECDILTQHGANGGESNFGPAEQLRSASIAAKRMKKQPRQGYGIKDSHASRVAPARLKKNLDGEPSRLMHQ